MSLPRREGTGSIGSGVDPGLNNIDALGKSVAVSIPSDDDGSLTRGSSGRMHHTIDAFRRVAVVAAQIHAAAICACGFSLACGSHRVWAPSRVFRPNLHVMICTSHS